MSDKKKKADDQDQPVKKKGGFVKFLLLGVVLIGAGAGTVFGLMTAGVIGGAAAEAKEMGPQLVMKGAEDPYAPVADSKDKAPAVVHGEGGSKYRTAYYSFAEDFTSNLSNTDALVQISLAASTTRDGRVLMWLDEHQLAIRSRILVEIADTPEEEVITSAGKERLQKRLTAAVNEVLEEREGYGGVDNIYFRTFIVQ